MSEEIWKDIEGFEGRYQVSNLGRVKSLPNKCHKNEKILVPVPDNSYLKVCLSKDCKQKNYLVHRLVAKAFIPNPENKEQVNHINGNKHDNRAENLEWVTLQENNKHAHKFGLVCDNNGSKNGKAKLTEEQVIEIRKEYAKSGISQSQLAKKYGVAQARISEIVNKKAWKHI